MAVGALAEADRADAEQRLQRPGSENAMTETTQAYCIRHHRHLRAPVGHKFSIAIADAAGVVRGVAMVGRPVSRMLDDGWTLEINRCCTDGVPNGCSMLYRAAWRAAQAMGYTRLVTYTLPEEGGASLRAAGFQLVGRTEGGKWTREERPRVDTHPTQPKLRWELGVEQANHNSATPVADPNS